MDKYFSQIKIISLFYLFLIINSNGYSSSLIKRNKFKMDSCLILKSQTIEDQTQTLQNIINNLPINGTFDGENKSYVVSSLFLKSNITIQNLILIAKAASRDFTSPITIIGTKAPKKNITLINVKINGNRQHQNNIISASEDGGRSGFRVVGNVSNLTIIDCEADYCATDGLELYSSSAAIGNDSYYTFNNIIIKNFKASFNRRHGISIDCANNVHIRNATLSDNGKDLIKSYPQTNGNRGARTSNGSLYGNGIDIEGYGIGTAIRNIYIDGLNAVQNASAGVLIMDPSDPSQENFIPRSYIYISNSIMDMGDDAKNDYAALYITSLAGVSAKGYSYNNIRIKNTKISGKLYLRGVQNAIIDIQSNFNIGNYTSQTIDCKNIKIICNSMGRAKKNYSAESHSINFISQ